MGWIEDEIEQKTRKNAKHQQNLFYFDLMYLRDFIAIPNPERHRKDDRLRHRRRQEKPGQ